MTPIHCNAITDGAAAARTPEASRSTDKIIVVDDDPATIYLIGRVLHGLSDLSFATSGEKALQLVHEATPDLILLDADLPGMSGFMAFDALKGEPELIDVPIIFISSHKDAGFEVSALNMGAADFIAKPFTASGLVARVQSHLRAKRTVVELRRAGATDSLTGAGGRRQFDEALDREWRRGRRAGHPIALLLIDVDYFDSYNERYGREQGDACLRRIAETIAGVARRPADFLARYQGKRFALLLPQTTQGGAQLMAHRILGAVGSLRMPHEASSAATHVTVSIGISCYDELRPYWVNLPSPLCLGDDANPCRISESLLRAADQALCSAKLAGRAQAQLLNVVDLQGPLPVEDSALAIGDAHSAQWS